MHALTETTVEGHSAPRLSQRHVLPQACAHPVHVVSSAKTNGRPPARAPVGLGSSDGALAYAPLVAYDGPRCQIECHFRDATPYWGVEACLHVTPTGVTHAVPLAWCMGNVAYSRRADGHGRDPASSVLDRKADYRGATFVEATIPMLPETPEPVLLATIRAQVACVGRMHAPPTMFQFFVIGQGIDYIINTFAKIGSRLWASVVE